MYIHFVFPFHIGLYNFIILFLGDWLDIVAAGRRLRSLHSLRCSLQCIFLLQRSKISLFTPTMKIPPNLTTDWFHYVSKYTLFTLRYYLLHQLSHITNTHISTRTSIYTRFFFSSSYFFRFSLSAKFCCFIQSFFVFGSNFHSVCVCVCLDYIPQFHTAKLISFFEIHLPPPRFLSRFFSLSQEFCLRIDSKVLLLFLLLLFYTFFYAL